MVSEKELWSIANENVEGLRQYFLALRMGDHETAGRLQRYLSTRIPDVVGIEENNLGLVCKTQEGLVLLHVNIKQEENMVSLALETDIHLE